jgi:Glycosyl hydrolases family 2, TIM barrel domain/Glycosyl hydrolases family 2/Glycosyl hydrolases family 2, sugar binding domain
MRMKIVSRCLISLSSLVVPLTGRLSAADWQPAQGPLQTRWAKDVSPENALPEYPRPQMVRKEWQNLNGLWEYAIRPKGEDRPEKFDGQILVPFPVESALSGVMKRVDEPNRLWYRRTFAIPKEWAGKNVLLHFGAVNWEATVRVNGNKLGDHRGGYDGFSFDITSALKPEGEQEIVVSAWNPIDAGTQPRGKQVRKPGGIFYTPTTGIWQTVWLEPVAATSVESIQIVPDIDRKLVQVTVKVRGATSAAMTVTAFDGDKQVSVVTGVSSGAIDLPISEPKLWSPDSPNLYRLQIRLTAAGGDVDTVETYFGMRKISIAKDDKGITRIFLNNKPQFMVGPLDQGFWPDGIYTAPTDEALRYDIEMTRKLGFNMARKHVKVEPDRWYYWADKLGLLVWQDMPSGDRSIGPNSKDLVRSKESAEQYEMELKRMIDGRRNHPSIVMWVVFNEGWGQFDTARITNWTKEYDPSRLVDCASGWADRNVGDVHDIHVYPGPGTAEPEEHRAAVLGEFGGLGLPLEGHTWQSKSNWGYRSFTDREALTEAYLSLMRHLHPQIGDPGMSAAVYTQTTDVETEVNGLMTYDRQIVKPDIDRIAAAHRKLFTPPPKLRVIAATSEREPQNWRYIFDKPSDAWMKTDFDDSAWTSGPAGFGTIGTPGAVVRTEWKTADIWLRRTVDLPADKLFDPSLLMHHDDDAEVYLNGVLAIKTKGYTTRYEPFSIRDEAGKALHPGKNVIAVHCHQYSGGQYIDVGLVDFEEEQ